MMMVLAPDGAPSVAFGDTSPNRPSASPPPSPDGDTSPNASLGEETASLGEETGGFSPQERRDVGGSAGVAGEGGAHA